MNFDIPQTWYTLKLTSWNFTFDFLVALVEHLLTCIKLNFAINWSNYRLLKVDKFLNTSSLFL